MASDCEVLIENAEAPLAEQLLCVIAAETWRIEHKFSRYLRDNVLGHINNSDGRAIRVDEETASLLDFADQCHRLSGGMFDITSGVLRRLWRFNGQHQVPEHAAIDALLPTIGWHRLQWEKPWLTLAPGMELDFGGIGKEYAVDRAMAVAKQAVTRHATPPMLINFGGDLACNGPRQNGSPWQVGVESHAKIGQTVAHIELSQGAIATSGNSQRFILHQGKRLSHILNPLTGWPVEHTPHSISVAAPSCLQAGMLATLTMLQGNNARDFIRAQGLAFWLQE